MSNGGSIALAACALLTFAVGDASAQTAPEPPRPAPPAAVEAPDPVRLAAAREVVDALLPPAERQAMFRQAIDAMMGNMMAGVIKAEGLDQVFGKHPRARDAFNGFLVRQRDLALKDLEDSTPELMTAYANAYARRFTIEELAALKGFFTTPVGQKYARVSRAILADPDIAAWMRGVAERGQRRARGELDRFKEEIAPLLAEDGKSDGS